VQEFRLRGDELLEDPKVGKTKYSRAKSGDGVLLHQKVPVLPALRCSEVRGDAA
jgi:hypothetical protein